MSTGEEAQPTQAASLNNFLKFLLEDRILQNRRLEEEQLRITEELTRCDEEMRQQMQVLSKLVEGIRI